MKTTSLSTFIRANWFSLGILLLVLVKHSLLAEQPFVARSGYPHDDTLFLTNSIYLLSGEWFGPFNQMTLLRGPFYPFWLSFVHILGLPLIHANDVLHLAASIAVVRALWPIVTSRRVLFIVFVFLYFAPHTYDYATISHSFRMSIYPALALLLFGAALGLSIRLLERLPGVLYWSLLLAFSFVFFWFVREEGIWVVPALLLLLIFVLVSLKVRSFGWSAVAAALVWFVVVPGLLFYGVSGGLKYMNNKYYGAPVIIDIKAPEFKRAYNALLSVKAPEPIRYVHVTRDTLKQLYQVSPKMAELQDYLDRGARALPFNKELPAATFFFSFRDAVASVGYYDQGLPAVLAFYDELGAEIEAACQDGRLSCGKLVYPLVPLWQDEFTVDLPHSFIRQFDQIFRFPEFSPYTDRFASSGDQRFLNNVGRLIHAYPQATPKTPASFPNTVRDIKLAILDDIGTALQKLRFVLFYLCAALLLWFIVADLREKRVNLLPVFGVSLIGAISGLAAVLSIIDVTSFHRLFRARHGAVALVSLFVVCILCEWYRRWKERQSGYL